MAPSSDLLALYELAVEMADRVSARRGSANAFFLAVQTTFVGLLGSLVPAGGQDVGTSVIAALAGVALSFSWWMQLRSYRLLNGAKFEVISRLERALPAQIFADEWQVLKDRTSPVRRRRYAELGAVERLVPAVFGLLHLGLLLRQAL